MEQSDLDDAQKTTTFWNSRENTIEYRKDNIRIKWYQNYIKIAFIKA